MLFLGAWIRVRLGLGLPMLKPVCKFLTYCANNVNYRQTDRQINTQTELGKTLPYWRRYQFKGTQEHRHVLPNLGLPKNK